MKRLSRYPVVLSTLLGALSPAAFAPLDWYLLLPLCLAALFWLSHDLSPRRAMACGFMFGTGQFAVGVSWVYVSLSTFGGMPMALAVVCVIGFVALLSLFPMLATGLPALIRGASPAQRLVLLLPAFWVSLEILRNHVLTGFSWLESGYSQTGHLLEAFAPVAGIHAVSLALSLCSGLLASLLVCGRRGHLGMIAGFTAIVLFALALTRVEWTEAFGEPVSTAMVQAVVPIERKWNPAEGEKITREYLELSSQHQDVDLIIWPESALTLFVDQLGAEFYDRLIRLETPLLAGFLERRPVARGFDYFNSAVLFDEPSAIYRKRHLVPFGEYTPLAFLFDPLARYFNIPMSILSAWPELQAPMDIAGYKVGISICYEDAFPQDIRATAGQAHFLVNLSEDAWFGKSLGPAQRMQMARMRSLETGRPMFRSSNTAYSAVIDHRGVVTALSRPFDIQVLRGTLQPRSGLTPYVRHGDVPVWGLIILMMLAGFWPGFGQRRNPAHSY